MFGRSNRSDSSSNPEGRRYRSRLDEVLAMIRARALFWDRTSVSVFLAMLALIGIAILFQGWQMLFFNQANIQILHRMAPAGSWSFLICGVGILGFGINLIIPLPLYWLIPERRVLQITLGMLGLNILIYGYGFLLGSITLTNLSATAWP